MSTDTVSTRARLVAVAAFALTSALGAANANAQTVTSQGSNGFELRPYAGAFIPTGQQRDFLKDAVIVGGQASYRIVPQLAITGTLGWSPSKDRITPGDQTLDVWQYDLGAELRAPSWVRSGSWDFTPFVGLGGGGRTYNYRDLDVDSKTNVAGFGTLGGELGYGRIGLRVEGRDYVSQFKPFTGGDSKTRNDVTVAAGLSLRF
jgi:hypothetical protein